MINVAFFERGIGGKVRFSLRLNAYSHEKIQIRCLKFW